MRKRTYNTFILRIVTFILLIVIAADINNHDSLSARTETAKLIIPEEKTPDSAEKNSMNEKEEISKASIEITPAITDQKTPESKNENSTAVKKEQAYIKSEDIFDHPEIILNAYKEAYPDLITDVVKGENDWIIKFANGNLYYWADGKILPESALQKSDKYIRYPINPYNINGRSPESYTEKKIEELRIKKHPSDKKKIVPGEEGSFYKELFGITTKKSSKKQLVEVNLFGYYMTVHYTLAEKIKSIDSKVRQLEKGDTEVRSFLKNIRSVQSFNWRKIAGSGHRSNHSYGIAIDILPKKYNEKTIYWSWEQEKNEDWMLLPQSSLWAPPDSIVKIFLEEKFIWGGHWDRYDTMHFEYRPELIFLFKNIKFDQ